MTEVNGVYVPTGLPKNPPVHRCTSDGRNTFHGTALDVHHHLPQNVSGLETVFSPLVLMLDNVKPLQNVPSTVVEIECCNITGNPKPQIKKK